MATMDSIKRCGGEPANFLDIGGGANSEKVKAALQIIISDPNIRSILINIFGGITRCDQVAEGILAALHETKIMVPLIVRLVGTNSDLGKKILQDQDQITANTLYEAAQLAVASAQGNLA
jgi:succinyl-CoA synthetase beta subunit